MYNFYKFITFFFLFFSHLFLKLRVLKNKEHPFRYREKLGFYKIKNTTETIWFHASSLGEIKSIIPIIFYYNKNYNNKILITTTTLSSAKFCSYIFKNNSKIIHQFAPLDVVIIIKRFLSHWKPKICFFTESELWPNLIFESKKNSKLILINARLSPKSFYKWKLVKKFAKKIFKSFDLIIAQSKRDKSYIKYFDILNVKFFGNLKFVEHINKKKNNFNFKSKIKFTWVAMSTHEGEEEFIIETIKKIKEQQITSQCVLIPRHISRVKKIINLIKKNNLTFQIRTKERIIKKNIDIYVLNTFGEAKEVFKKTQSVFLGGSIVPRGGQNPIEPAQEGCSLFHGPHITNFEEIYRFLNKHKIAKLVTTPDILTSELIKKYNNPSNNNKFKKISSKYSQKILHAHIKCLNSLLIKNEI